MLFKKATGEYLILCNSENPLHPTDKECWYVCHPVFILATPWLMMMKLCVQMTCFSWREKETLEKLQVRKLYLWFRMTFSTNIELNIQEMHLQGELVVTSSWNHHEPALHLASLLLCRRSSFCNAYTSTAKPMLSIQRDCIRLGYTSLQPYPKSRR